MKLKIDLSDIVLAMESPYESHSAALNLETGQVIHLSDDFLDAIPAEDIGLTEELVNELKESGYRNLPPRFLEIPQRDSREGFRWMREFADSQTGHAARQLDEALSGPIPFRNFKQALSYLSPDVLKAWYEHRNNREEELARQWLDESEIEYVETKPGE